MRKFICLVAKAFLDKVDNDVSEFFDDRPSFTGEKKEAKGEEELA